jgi:hypothetical protein
MASTAFSTAHLDYLQRISAPAPLSADAPKTSAPPNLRRLWRVRGTGRLEKAIEKQLGLNKPEQQMQLVSKDVLMAMYGHKYNLVFLVKGTPEEVAIHIGTWSPASGGSRSAQEMNLRQQVLKSALNSIYPAIELADVGVELDPFPLSGFVLGIPTAKPMDPPDGTVPLDRLIRALTDATWASLVLAQPVEESEISFLRNSVISEIRGAESLIGVERAPSPLAKYYSDLLTKALKSLSSGAEVGFWRTGVYLLGKEESYRRLASVWRGIFSGDDSLPEPVRVWDGDALRVAKLAAEWALPDVQGPRGPGQSQYRHPLQYQTLLTSGQLAAYIHLPQLETRGFRIEAVPDFDVAPRLPETKHKTIPLGTVIERGRQTETPYGIALDDLTRHAFVAGVTGAGKTNTVFSMLKQAAEQEVKFLVLEPAKKEYRALVYDKTLRGALQVFTLGDELTSPFRLNPFEVVSWPEIPVGVHLDLLRSVFAASFGMWTPLPQVLERCLHAVYQDRGWDITTNTNHRLDSKSDLALAFPTLGELAAKADEIIQKLGYEAKITDDLRAALLTRLNGLRVGGKGAMLDVQRSLPMDILLTRPTVLELQNMGDDDDKAFLMGLLLIRLYEYRRGEGERANLQHIIVVEEAHRLLSNSGPRKDEEQGDPHAKAVETFSNLLSEIRAYGQGVVIADQVPVKLAPDIIKNTNLKVAHRIVASDDRAAMAGAMAMQEKQAQALATLNTGQAAVFSTGDDAPVLVQVPKSKDYEGTEPPTDAKIREYMSSSEQLRLNKAILQPLLTDIDMSNPAAYRAKDAARDLADDPTFRRDFVRLVISMTEDDGALARLWNDLIVRAQAVREDGMSETVMLRSLMIYACAWLTHRRGSQQGWSYADTGELEGRLREVLLAKLEGKDTLQPLKSFRDVTYRLHPRRFEPFVGCSRICTQTPPVCLYRLAVADYIAQSKVDLGDAWDRASQRGSTPQERLQSLWDVSDSVSHELIESHEEQADVSIRIRLCFEQHMLRRQFSEVHISVLQRLLNAYTRTSNGGEKNG